MEPRTFEIPTDFERIYWCVWRGRPVPVKIQTIGYLGEDRAVYKVHHQESGATFALCPERCYLTPESAVAEIKGEANGHLDEISQSA